jgi:hypothetical protein
MYKENFLAPIMVFYCGIMLTGFFMKNGKSLYYSAIPYFALFLAHFTGFINLSNENFIILTIVLALIINVINIYKMFKEKLLNKETDKSSQE